jgi:hypothetical protein
VWLAGGLLIWSGCALLPEPARPGREVIVEVPVTAADLGERAARLTLGPPIPGELRFSFDKCEWSGTGAMRTDRACVGSFALHTPRGSIGGGARSLWTGYRALLALHGAVRVGHGCLVGVTGGSLDRQGPVSFPRLPVSVRLTLAPGTTLSPHCVALRRTLDVAAIVTAARVADPAASVLALRALALALASPREDVRAAAVASLGFAASDPLYGAVLARLAGDPELSAQVEEARHLRQEAGSFAAPLECDAPGALDDEVGELQVAACRGFAVARGLLTSGLASPARRVRRGAARLLAVLGGAEARRLFDEAIHRAVAGGDLTAAVDLAEAALLTSAR